MSEVAELRKPRAAAAAPQDHDLPVLAFEMFPPARVDWEQALDDGFGPALILGAERRLHGLRAGRR